MSDLNFKKKRMRVSPRLHLCHTSQASSHPPPALDVHRPQWHHLCPLVGCNHTQIPLQVPGCQPPHPPPTHGQGPRQDALHQQLLQQLQALARQQPLRPLQQQAHTGAAQQPRPLSAGGAPAASVPPGPLVGALLAALGVGGGGCGGPPPAATAALGRGGAAGSNGSTNNAGGVPPSSLVEQLAKLEAALRGGSVPAVGGNVGGGWGGVGGGVQGVGPVVGGMVQGTSQPQGYLGVGAFLR